MPVHATASATTSGCDNSPGPYVTLNGALAVGGLGTRLTFTNNQKGTHSYSVQAQHDVTVIPAGQAITIPKQPVLGGAGGNPFIWLQLVDDKGDRKSTRLNSSHSQISYAVFCLKKKNK